MTSKTPELAALVRRGLADYAAMPDWVRHFWRTGKIPSAEQLHQAGFRTTLRGHTAVCHLRQQLAATIEARRVRRMARALWVVWLSRSIGLGIARWRERRRVERMARALASVWGKRARLRSGDLVVKRARSAVLWPA